MTAVKSVGFIVTGDPFVEGPLLSYSAQAVAIWTPTLAVPMPNPAMPFVIGLNSKLDTGITQGSIDMYVSATGQLDLGVWLRLERNGVVIKQSLWLYGIPSSSYTPNMKLLPNNVRFFDDAPVAASGQSTVNYRFGITPMTGAATRFNLLGCALAAWRVG
jgi:hypothetical protein